MKTKVFYLIDSLAIGGAEKSLLEILQNTEQIEPQVCHVYDGDVLRPSFEKAGIQVFSLGISGKHSYGIAVRKVLKILQKQKPQLIHTILTRSHFVGRTAGKIAKIPVVCSLVNDSYSPERYQQLPLSSKWKMRFIQLMDRITSRWSCHFIANSVTLKNSYCRSLGIPNEKVSVIYRGREPSRFACRDSEMISHLRKSLSIPEDAKVILNTARMIPQKAQKDLIAAISLIRREHNVRLLIAGDGSSRASVQERIHELKLTDSVQLLGYRMDVAELLNLADIFVFPSYYEGHPGSLIEAMFAGLPIVASDIPVHRETIRDGETGLLVPVNAPDAIAGSVSWLLRNPEKALRMGKLAQADAVKLFHIQQIARQHEQLYSDLLERGVKL